MATKKLTNKMLDGLSVAERRYALACLMAQLTTAEQAELTVVCLLRGALGRVLGAPGSGDVLSQKGNIGVAATMLDAAALLAPGEVTVSIFATASSLRQLCEDGWKNKRELNAWLREAAVVDGIEDILRRVELKAEP